MILFQIHKMTHLRKTVNIACILFTNTGILFQQMLGPRYDLWEVPPPMRDELRYSTTTPGVRSVMTVLTIRMRPCCVEWRDLAGKFKPIFILARLHGKPKAY